MSLTSALSSPTTPLRRLLDTLAPAGAMFVRADYRHRLPITVPLAVPDGVDREVGNVGRAVDGRLRLAFTTVEPIAEATLLAIQDMKLLGTRQGLPRGRWWAAIAEAGAEAAAEITTLAQRWRLDDRNRPLVRDPDQERRLAQLLIVGSWFEVLTRAGRIGFDGTPIALHAGGLGGLPELVDLVPEPMIADVTAQIAAAEDSELAAVRSATRRSQCTTAPTFAGSTDIGGADGDLLVNGLLLDFKCARDPWEMRLTTIHQLLGYALLDYSNSHRIHSLGVYSTRIGALINWDMEQFLRLLGCTLDLNELRRHCQTVCRHPAAGWPAALHPDDTSEDLLASIGVHPRSCCVICGARFKIPSNRRRYCSPRCRSEASRDAWAALTYPDRALRLPRPACFSVRP